MERNDLWIYLAVPVFLTVLMCSFRQPGSYQTVALLFFMNSLTTVTIGLTINALYHLIGERLRFKTRSPPVRYLIHVVFIGAGVMLGSELALQLGSLFVPDMDIYFPRTAVMRVAVPVSIAVVAIAFGVEKLRTRAKEIELREERAKRELLTAQLEALRARTNPHFLFNSLNTVASLIEIDPERAERSVERLSSLFRYTLDGSRTPSVPLSAELEAVESYLAFEALRFGDKMRYVLEIEPGLEAMQVPPLVLQPLVENAVKHGVSSRREGGRVTITARRVGAQLSLSVEDDGPGPEGSAHRGSGSGTAQADLEARLKIVYGDRASLICRPGSSGGYHAEVLLPVEPARS